MKRLEWWFRGVGLLYVTLGLGFFPPLNAARLPAMLPGFDAPEGGVAYRALLDFSFMFGLDLLVIGAFLLVAARQPLKYAHFVWLVVALEAVRGVLDDIYMIVRGYEAPFYLGFIVVHLIIIATGIMFLRQARTKAGRDSAQQRSDVGESSSASFVSGSTE